MHHAPLIWPVLLLRANHRKKQKNLKPKPKLIHFWIWVLGPGTISLLISACQHWKLWSKVVPRAGVCNAISRDTWELSIIIS